METQQNRGIDLRWKHKNPGIHRPTPAGPVRWRYWPSKGSASTQIVCNLKIACHPEKNLESVSWVFEKAGSLDSLDWTGLRLISLHQLDLA
jgi:hypothetical protein